MNDPAASRAESVRQRIRNCLRERGEDAQLGLERYAAERFLYRLGLSRHRDRFILKGAALFALWGGPTYRPTRDLDFTGYGSAAESDVVSAVREVCALEIAGEELTFDPQSLSSEPIREDSEYHGQRVRLTAVLGESRIPLQIDIGFGNAVEPPPADVEYPTLLGDPAPRIRAYPQEAQVAEKFQAMVSLGEINSRYKDFYDLFVMARRFTFDGLRLAESIVATFGRRRTAIQAALPAALTPRFYADSTRGEQWRAYLTRNSLPGAPADFLLAGELLMAFLCPLWGALAVGGTFADVWPAGGPWGGKEAGG